MPTITIRLDDETDARLKRRLARSGETLSGFVRAAVVNQLGSAPEPETAYAAWARLVQDCDGSGAGAGEGLHARVVMMDSNVRATTHSRATTTAAGTMTALRLLRQWRRGPRTSWSFPAAVPTGETGGRAHDHRSI